MTKKRIWFIVLMLLGLTAVINPTRSKNNQTTTVTAQENTPPTGISVVRVYYNDPAKLALLSDYDLFEFNNLKEKYVLAAVNAVEMQNLRTIGFKIEVDANETAVFNQPAPFADPDQNAGIPGYACYRTVEETFTTAQDIVTNYPTLASWTDVGDSWEKTALGGNPGYDMQVLKLTNSATSGSKPKIFIMSSVHAREYTPAELNTRFAEMLVANYNVDADVTWLLDYHEIHLMLQANPDGRKQAETGISWRKNTNENYCGTTSNSRGADLNRNFDFQWGCCGGSSTSQCNPTYRGPSAGSEPEVAAVQDYVRSIFPDQRGPLITDPAPADATGIFLDVHSYSELILWPWGWGNTVAPNGTALQTLGRKFGNFNNYYPEQSIGLYATDGTTGDFAYGELGLAAYTFELGTAFFQSCSTFENTIVPTNMPALIYAAKAARAPYLLPAGPEATSVTLSAGAVAPGTAVNLTAIIDDTQFNNSNGTEPTQSIAAAEYTIDAPHWDGSPTAYAMSAGDGSFNSTVETAVASIDTTGLGNGRHTLYVRGQDSDGNWGVVTAVFLYIIDPAVAPRIEGYVREAGTLLPLDGTVSTQSALFQATTNPASGYYQMQVIPDSYNLTAASTGYGTQTVSGIPAANFQTIGQNFYLSGSSCTIYASSDVPKAISASGTPTVSSVINIPASGTLTDVNLLNLIGTHTYISDLDFTLQSPTGTNALLIDSTCDTENNFDLSLDDEAAPGSWPCPPVDGGTYQPDAPLAAFDGEEVNGTWTLTIKDNFNQDGGSLNGWSLEVCTQTVTCSVNPPVISGASISASGSTATIAWTDDVANAGGYELYRSSTPYFSPLVSNTLGAVGAGNASFADAGGIGNTATNYFYAIRALNCDYSGFIDSQELGEFDFAITAGTP